MSAVPSSRQFGARRNRRQTPFHDPAYEASRPQWGSSSSESNYDSDLAAFLQSRLQRLNQDRTTPSTATSSFPTREQIKRAQQTSLSAAPSESIQGSDGLFYVEKRI